jgi:hypothetical protein
MSETLAPRSRQIGPDLLGAAYFIAAVAFLVTNADLVAATTKAHPYAMGFAKFAILATFGECLKNRILTSRWLPTRVGLRFVIWGFFGMWITAVFPFMDGGVKTLITLHLWPAEPGAFWMSTWANVFSGFAFFMMLTHYWTDTMLVEGWVWPWDLFARPATVRWARIVLISLFLFWVPAHTFTFMLPPVWRTLCAAFLGIALGLILSFAARRK